MLKNRKKCNFFKIFCSFLEKYDIMYSIKSERRMTYGIKDIIREWN